MPWKEREISPEEKEYVEGFIDDLLEHYEPATIIDLNDVGCQWKRVWWVPIWRPGEPKVVRRDEGGRWVTNEEGLMMRPPPRPESRMGRAITEMLKKRPVWSYLLKTLHEHVQWPPCKFTIGEPNGTRCNKGQ